MTPKLSGLERINAAAVHVFGRRGFAEATTQEIAKTGEVSEGLIYRYYDTKQALGLELFKKHYQEVLARLAEGNNNTDENTIIIPVTSEFERRIDRMRRYRQTYN